MAEHTIRLANVADLAPLLGLYRHLNPDDPPVDPARAGSVWRDMLATPSIRVLLAEIDGKLASSCTLALVANLTRGGRPYGVIENVDTHPNYRRLGLGRAVLKAALENAWAQDCYKIMLATGSRKPETLKFYESAGFAAGSKTFFQARRD